MEPEAVETDALAYTGGVRLFVPLHIKVRVQLEEMDTKEMTLVDAGRNLVPYAGPVQLRYKNRTGFGGAMVLGDMPLPEVIPMELHVIGCGAEYQAGH